MIAVDNSGRMWSWGSDTGGRLGRDSANRPVPGLVQFPAGEYPTFLDLGVNISQNSSHVLAICDDFRLWTWGTNANGQLGDGSATNRYRPQEVLIEGQSRRWRSANAGSNFSMAVAWAAGAEDGLIWAWGNNDFGQLGKNAPGNHSTPWRNPFNRTN